MQPKHLTKLISKPFEKQMVIRDSMRTFPKPNLMSFDGFNTLYQPRENVFEQYQKIFSNVYGINKDKKEIETSFKHQFAELSRKYPRHGKNILPSYRDWWKELIVSVFEVDHYSTNTVSNELCESLIKHFESCDAYVVKEGVRHTLERLYQSGIKLIVSSNSDPSVLNILSNLDLLKYFDHVFLAYNLEVEKPQKLFFDKVISELTNSKFSTWPAEDRYAYLEKCWHVGDNKELDYTGSIRAGWNGIYLNSKSSTNGPLHVEVPKNDACFQTNSEHPVNSVVVIANNRVIVDKFRDITHIFTI